MGIEYLVVHGRIDRVGRFELRRAYSTPAVRRWPEVRFGEHVWLQLHDREGNLLHREAVRAEIKQRCGALAAPDWHITAAIGLHPEAADLRLVMGERTLWARAVPSAPALKLSAKAGGTDARHVQLAAEFDSPGRDAWMAVAYTWAPRRMRVVYRGEPRAKLAIDLDSLPGGRDCKLLVSYSNGLRSARVASRPFSIVRHWASASPLDEAGSATGRQGRVVIGCCGAWLTRSAFPWCEKPVQ